jgi:hypothetical protein
MHESFGRPPPACGLVLPMDASFWLICEGESDARSAAREPGIDPNRPNPARTESQMGSGLIRTWNAPNP